MSRKWIKIGWFGKANVLRRATLGREADLAQLLPGPRVTGGRVSPPGLASTAQAGGGTRFILIKNNNSIILWITISVWLNSQTRLTRFEWIVSAFLWKISRTCCQRKAAVWDCKFPSIAESLPPTDWMTWAVTWSRDPALSPHWSDPPVYFLAVPVKLV